MISLEVGHGNTVWENERSVVLPQAGLPISEVNIYHLGHYNSPKIPHAVTVNRHDALSVLAQM